MSQVKIIDDQKEKGLNFTPSGHLVNETKSKNAEIFKKAGGKPVKPNGR